MFRKAVLQALLGVWALWHLSFGLLATFAPATGATLSGWSPRGGWNADMVGLSTQYGMLMVLLAGVYAIMAAQPLHYLRLLWIAVGEQLLGIAYAVYLYFTLGNVTTGQVLVQASVNVVVASLFLGFWFQLADPARARRQDSSVSGGRVPASGAGEIT